MEMTSISRSIRHADVLFLIILTFGSVRFIKCDSLYTEADSNVINLDVSNFTDTIVNSNNAWIVEFYATWCGHCQRLAPIWKAFADDIKDWNSVIKVAAIPCSDANNTEVCRQYNIWGYPSVRFMPPYASAGYDGEPYRGKGTVEEFREASVDFLEGLTMKPNTWPKLQPVQSLDSYSEAVARGMLVFVLFEDIGDAEYEPYTGREVVMDFSSQQILTNVVRMDRSAADKLNIGGLPVLFRLMPDLQLQKIAEKQDRERFRTAIKVAIQQYSIAAVTSTTTTTTTTPDVTPTTSGSTKRLWLPTVGVYMQDLEAGLYYSLWVEVGSHRSIRGPSMEALKAYVHVLAKHFPGSLNVQNFLKKADDWLQRRRGGISGTMWRRKFERFKSENAYIPSAMRWRSCTGSQPHFRGYPCSLWTIFHTLTVAAYDKHFGEENFDAKEVLTVIRDYVDNFLGCRNCAEHFLQMSIANVTKPEDVVLWLWRVHNKANHRLAGDITEDPRHPKVQFPTMWMCPTCRSGVHQNTQEIIWNESEVLEFLRRFYGEHYIIQTPWSPDESTSTVDLKSELPGTASPTLDTAPPPKLRTAPPAVRLLMVTPEDRQDEVLAFHGPNIRVYDSDANGGSDVTTPDRVAPVDQRRQGHSERTATNPFSPDFPQRERYFDPHANKPDHRKTTEQPHRSTHSKTFSQTTQVPYVIHSATTMQPPVATFRLADLTEEYKRSTPEDDINHYPHSQFTTRPVNNQFPRWQASPTYPRRSDASEEPLEQTLPTQRPYFDHATPGQYHGHFPQQQTPYYPGYRRPQVTMSSPINHISHHDNGLISHIYSHNNKPHRPSSSAIGRPRNCVLQTTHWSHCSMSCGAGMSTRYSNDNPRCRMELEMRICKLRPCNIAFRENFRKDSCGATFRAVWEEPIEYGSCSSVVSQKWRYCGTCPGMCCRPVIEDTNWMTLVCKNGEMAHSKFMWIRMCRCLPGRC